MLILEKEPNSFEAEAYRILRTNIQHSSFFRSDIKSILITSGDSKEEKSTVACNIGLSFAQNGQSVIIVDCDLRNPFIHNIFNIPNDSGVVDILVKCKDLNESIKKYNENLYILTSGDIPQNPSEMLDTHEMDFLIERLKQRFDIIILDSSPLQDVTDAQILATKTDGTILVVRSGKSTKDTVLEAKNLLDKVGANIIGAVLTDITEHEVKINLEKNFTKKNKSKLKKFKFKKFFRKSKLKK